MTGTLPTFRRRLLDWYDAHQRTLPWRATPGSTIGPDPYYVLVSEAMLQQTQVATVIPYFKRFLERFPTIESLAFADEQSVLHAWQGLGYYSRARNLKKAAMMVVESFGGDIPSTVEQLLELPGVGRYTAGAIASIAFGRRSPILDGNVSRVLCRIDAIGEDPTKMATRDLLWARAEQVLPKDRSGDFNSALMELGALVCIPRSPHCLVCPVRRHCDAAAAGLQEKIPPPKKRKAKPLLRRWVFVIRRGDRYLMQQRPATGRWAGMWQFITVEAGDGRPNEKILIDNLGIELPCRDRLLLTPTPMSEGIAEDPDPAESGSSGVPSDIGVAGEILEFPGSGQSSIEPISMKSIGTVRHALTHRDYEFEVVLCEARTVQREKIEFWKTLEEIDLLPLPKPHVTIRRML